MDINQDYNSMKCKYTLDKLDGSKCFINPNSDNHQILRLNNIHGDYKKYFGDFFERRRVRLFRYIILVYDKDSPLTVKEPKLSERKIQGALLAQLTRQGEFPDEVIKVMEGNSQEDEIKNIYKAIVRYMLQKPDPTHISLITYWQLLAGFSSAANNGQGGKDDKLVKAIKSVTEHIKEAEQEMFAGKEGNEIRNLISNSMGVQDVEFRPEKMAREKTVE